jgi:metallophosphoesterase superfamily enzyme
MRLKPDRYLVFLGDMIDRGPFGVDILVLVMIMKIANKEQVLVIDGNHETHPTYNHYGFADEIRTEYGDDVH